MLSVTASVQFPSQPHHGKRTRASGEEILMGKDIRGGGSDKKVGTACASFPPVLPYRVSYWCSEGVGATAG